MVGNCRPRRITRRRASQLPAPDSLKPGYYFIAASHDPKFGEKDNMVSHDRRLGERPGAGDADAGGRIEGFVLKANSGEPIPRREVSVWHLDQPRQPRRRSDVEHGRERVLLPRSPARTAATCSARATTARSWPRRSDLWGPMAGRRRLRLSPRHRRSSSPTARSTGPGRRSNTRAFACGWTKTKDNYEVLKGEQLTVVFQGRERQGDRPPEAAGQ